MKSILDFAKNVFNPSAVCCLVSGGILALAVSGPAPAQKRNLQIADLFRLRQAKAPALSPDGHWIVYPLAAPQPASDRYQTHLYRVSFSGRDTLQLTFGEHSEWSVQWSPEGTRIAFLSDRSGTPQIWVTNPFHGEPQQITALPAGVQEFAWSPDGSQLALVAPDSTLLEGSPVPEKNKAWMAAHPRRFCLYVYSFQNRRLRRLAESQFSIASPVWSPDGRYLYFVRHQRPAGHNGMKSGIYMVSADSGAVRPVVETGGQALAPLPSPDGQWLAFAWRPEAVAGPDRLAMVPALGGEPIPLGKHDSGSVKPLFWSAEDNGIYVRIAHGLQVNLFRFDLATRQFQNISEEPNVLDHFSFSADGRRVAFNLEKPDRPAEVYSAEIARFEPKRLTFSNPWLRIIAFGETRTVRWQGQDGRRLEGLLVLPINFRRGEPVPLMVCLHDRQTGAYRRSFLGRWDLPVHFWAGLGYAIFLPNFRGSDGYGEPPSQIGQGKENLHRIQDILTGVDSLITAGIADSSRMALVGWNEGAQLVWGTLTQNQRFRAAVIGFKREFGFSASVESPVTVTLPEMEPTILRQFFASLLKAKSVDTPVLIFECNDDAAFSDNLTSKIYQTFKVVSRRHRLVQLGTSIQIHGAPRLQKRKLEEELSWFNLYLQGRPVKPEGDTLSSRQMALLPRIGPPCLSPDGRLLLYAQEEWDESSQEMQVRLYRQNQRQEQVLLNSALCSTTLRWRPRHQEVTCLARLDIQPQLIFLNPYNGEIVSLLSPPGNVKDFSWSPDGRLLAMLISSPSRGNGQKRGASGGFQPAAEESPPETELWVYDTLSEKLRNVTPAGKEMRCFSWLSDDHRIAVAFSDTGGEKTGIGMLDIQTKACHVSNSTGAGFVALACSPDGNFLAARNNQDVWLFDFANDTLLNLTAAFHPSIQDFLWRNNNELLFLADTACFTSLFRVRLPEKRFTFLSAGKGLRRHLAADAAGRDWAWLEEYGDGIWRLARATPPLYDEEVWASPTIRLSDSTLASPTCIQIEVGAQSIPFLVYRPPNYEENVRFPVILLLADFPEWFSAATLRKLASLLAANGYLVMLVEHGLEEPLLPNRIDSQLEVIDKQFDRLVSRFQADTSRMGLVGIGIGGLFAQKAMATVKGIRAAVVWAGVSDVFSLYGQIEKEVVRQKLFLSSPYLNPDAFLTPAVMKGEQVLQIPLLLLHGNRDAIIPSIQSLEWYQVFKKRGGLARLLLYPDVGHDPREMNVLTDLFERILNWFDNHLWPPAAPVYWIVK